MSNRRIETVEQNRCLNALRAFELANLSQRLSIECEKLIHESDELRGGTREQSMKADRLIYTVGKIQDAQEAILFEASELAGGTE